MQIIGGGQLRTSLKNEQHILEMIAAKTVTPAIARTLPIEEAAQAHRLLATGQMLGKIVLVHS